MFLQSISPADISHPGRLASSAMSTLRPLQADERFAARHTAYETLLPRIFIPVKKILQRIEYPFNHGNITWTWNPLHVVFRNRFCIMQHTLMALNQLRKSDVFSISRQFRALISIFFWSFHLNAKNKEAKCRYEEAIINYMNLKYTSYRPFLLGACDYLLERWRFKETRCLNYEKEVLKMCVWPLPFNIHVRLFKHLSSVLQY